MYESIYKVPLLQPEQSRVYIIGGALWKMMSSISSTISFLVPRRKVWLTLLCNNAANIGEHNTCMQSEFCTRQNSIRRQEPPKMYIQCTSPGDGQTSCKVWLTSVEWHRCSNKAKMRNPLKFAGVPQTCQPISAVSGTSTPYCEDMCKRYRCLTSFFRMSMHA